MSLINKLKEIIRIQNTTGEVFGQFNPPISHEQIKQIEALIEEPLPAEFKELYEYTNGQDDSGKGFLFGESFMTALEIVKELELSRALIKPEIKTIEHPEKSESLLKRIVDFYISKAPKPKLFGLQKSWHKIEFSCSTGSYEGPYSYAKENTPSKERQVFKIDDYQPVAPIIKELHEVEKAGYNWDSLEFIVYSSGSYEVKRSFWDLENEITFTSTPENAIRTKYSYFKRLPVFWDSGGNYIGIDLDPDAEGKKGQIINFGRDENEMMVYANSLDDFFDFILAEIQNPQSELLNLKYHLHDTLKKLKGI